jgi:hypothetical protein
MVGRLECLNQVANLPTLLRSSVRASVNKPYWTSSTTAESVLSNFQIPSMSDWSDYRHRVTEKSLWSQSTSIFSFVKAGEGNSRPPAPELQGARIRAPETCQLWRHDDGR